MKKATKYFVLLLAIGVLIILIYRYGAAFLNEPNRVMAGDMEKTIEELISEYENNTKNFKEITVDEINDKINHNDEFYIYVGRVTCEWCRLFVNYLNEYSNENNIEIYYLDSTDTEVNEKIKGFREKNNIEFVPALLYYSKELGLQKVEFDITDEKFDKEKISIAIQEVLQR